MMYACPVCNGWNEMQEACPQCGQSLQDYGRTGDFYGPYSPYRPIDDIRLTNGIPDVRLHQCIHTCYCAHCKHKVEITIEETRV
ncbi:hypothetical protein [Marinicrinis sediminis]|uniref:DZANK-type domain-containing protein n=1 Tax=Marinicrinis sediminis TaxID=1652465 RepID=A0ABW5R7C4_9BACL